MDIERVNAVRAAWAANDAIRDAGLVEPEDIIQHKNIVYELIDGMRLRLDVYIPKNISLPAPTIVNVHGGGYFYGDKELYRFYSMDMAKRGFAVICFDYRLAPENRFPAPLVDLNEVMRWLERNAASYSLDSDRVYVIGDSAGAQLASHYATIYANPEYARVFGFEVPKVRIRAVSLACGMYDILKRLNSEEDRQLFLDYVGEDYDITDERLKNLNYIDNRFPATYVFSFSHDFLVAECKPFAELLKARGVNAEWRIYGTEADTEYGHVYHEDIRKETARLANDEQAAFLRRYL